MASLQERNGSYRISFLWDGERKAFTIGKVEAEEAESKAAQVNYLLMRLKQRLIVLPPDTDIVEYIRFDGKAPPAPPPEPKAEEAALTLTSLSDQYTKASAKSLEASTLEGIRIHFGHLSRVLGENFPIASLKVADLQKYIDQRSDSKGRHGRSISPATIRKEIISLRTAWNFAEPRKMVTGRFPAKGLRYPKESEKPIFQTREEIEHQISGGGLSKAEIADLYDAMYLKVDELEELLAHVKRQAHLPFIYPLFCFLAHTGARRSEAIRAKVTDVDFKARVITIHERKRVRGASSTRRVPMSTFLMTVLKGWVAKHPGGNYLFCQEAVVERSRTRSLTTGYKTQGKRPSSGKARKALVAQRTGHAVSPITRNEFHDHFKRVLADGKWDVLRGAHSLRHSFISACASRGIDQRLVETWAGHMSLEMSQRYAHLWPSVQFEAITSVFG